MTKKAIVIILLISIQYCKSNSLPIGAIQGKEEFIVKRASLWDRVRGKSNTEDSPKQTYKYQKLGKVNSKADKDSQGGSIGSNHSEGQSSGSNSSEKSSMRKPTPSWLQPGNFPEYDSLPLKSQSENNKLSSGGRKIENKANQFRGGVRQREFYRDGFTLVRGAKAARNALK